ncbi:MAG: endonuclease V [Elusimicrobiota bacterium]
MKIEFEKLISIQKEIAQKIKQKDYKKDIKTVIAFDISFVKNTGYGCGIVVDENLKIIKKEFLKKEVDFPYIPTFLAFREFEIIDEIYQRLNLKPDIVLIDGQGTAHPRKCGIAVHFGVKNNIPTIGVAKTHLYGRYTEPENRKFAYSYLYDEKNKVIGAVLRTKENSKPIFISPGNLIDVQSSIKIVEKFTVNYRIPQPIRLAHILANKFRKNLYVT